jgi:hypothetical protein
MMKISAVCDNNQTDRRLGIVLLFSSSSSSQKILTPLCQETSLARLCLDKQNTETSTLCTWLFSHNKNRSRYLSLGKKNMFQIYMRRWWWMVGCKTFVKYLNVYLIVLTFKLQIWFWKSFGSIIEKIRSDRLS